jgi:uncharacterized glyoxalase superfamily protein PhnB
MTLGGPTPILRVFDEEKAKAFYLGFLGFAVTWEHRFEPGFPLYLEVVRGGCVLHLSEHHGDATPGAALRVPVSDLDAFHAELAAQSYPYARPSIEAKPWGTRDMAVTDPFGNRLVFTEAADRAA